MSNTCPSCNKFASLNFEDPELESLDINDGVVSMHVTITRSSECCSETVKTASLEAEQDLSDELKEHLEEGHELSVEEQGVDPIEKGGGRYQASFFGATVSYTVHCTCQKSEDEPLHSGTLEDEVAASAMEEAC